MSTKKQNKNKQISRKRISRKHLRGGSNGIPSNSKPSLSNNEYGFLANGEEFELSKNNNGPANNNPANQVTSQKNPVKQTWGDWASQKIGNAKNVISKTASSAKNTLKNTSSKLLIGMQQLDPYYTVPSTWEPPVLSETYNQNNNIVVLTQKYKYIRQPDLKNVHIIQLLNNQITELSIYDYTTIPQYSCNINKNQMVVSNNNLDSAFYEAFTLNESLKTLEIYLGGTSFNDNSNLAKYVCYALRFNKTLTKLMILNRYVGLKAEILIPLAESLSKNNTLTTLNLNFAQIGNISEDKYSQVFESFIKAFSNNTTITTLYLDSNYLNSDFIDIIAKSLETNSILTTLTLNNNYINLEDASKIAEGLKNNKTLTTFNFNHNGDYFRFHQILDYKCYIVIAEALKTNNTLTHIELYSNKINGSQLDELNAAFSNSLDVNTTITYIKLTHSGILLSEDLLKKIDRNNQQLKTPTNS